MSKIIRNRDTVESRRFWDNVEAVAKEVETWSPNRRAGINVSTRRTPIERTKENIMKGIQLTHEDLRIDYPNAFAGLHISCQENDWLDFFMLQGTIFAYPKDNQLFALGDWTLVLDNDTFLWSELKEN